MFNFFRCQSGNDDFLQGLDIEDKDDEEDFPSFVLSREICHQKGLLTLFQESWAADGPGPARRCEGGTYRWASGRPAPEGGAVVGSNPLNKASSNS